MAGVVLRGQTTWKLTRDNDGNRTYHITFRVRALTTDGPATVLATPGLPLPGDPWKFDNDFDQYATCGQEVEVEPQLEGEPNTNWKLTYSFSTKNRWRCQDDKVEDPMLEPAKISGGFIKDKEEATRDRLGKPICNSAWEQMRGPSVEFDKSRPKVTIEQNVLTFYQAFVLPQLLIDRVNDRPLWGMPRRTVKLSDASFERKFYGRCYRYYTRKLEFECNPETFDRDLMDEGTKVLHGRWEAGTDRYLLVKIEGKDPDPQNPTHFDRFKDRNGENCRVLLDGKGRPSGVVTRTDQRYISAFKKAAGFNIGQDITETDFWVPFEPPLDLTTGKITFDAVSAWEEGRVYYQGEIVEDHDGDPDNPNLYEFWIASQDVRNFFDRQLRPILGEDLTPQIWRRLPSEAAVAGGTIDPKLVDRGAYSATADYQRGDYVYSATNGAGVGNLHVEYYKEYNLMVLQIPTDL